MCASGVVNVSAQSTASIRFDILEAEERGATSARDLLIIRNATRSRDIETARMAVRALGRLERPARIPDILLSLRHSLPEVRVEAANAIAQAASGFRTLKPAAGATTTLQVAQGALIARLNVETDANVRAALSEAIARLPYTNAADVERAETAIVGLAGTNATSTADRLGVAKGLEALLRIQRSVRPGGGQAIQLLKDLIRQAAARPQSELVRDARVRRLAIEALTSANALDDEIVTLAAADADPQVRRLAMRAAAISGAGMAHVPDGLIDPVGLVRLEALRALRSRADDRTCDAASTASSDADVGVALVAIDQLGACGQSQAAVALLQGLVAVQSTLAAPRGWHRNAHALLALASAAPDRAAGAFEPYLASPIWQVRMYAARAAAQLKDRALLQRLAADPDDRVATVALAALGEPARRVPQPSHEPSIAPVTADDLRQFAAPRAAITIRGVGRFELALITAEAPATVLRFVRLAESGYYNGLTFDRLAPNAIVQGGRRGVDDARYPHPEVGTWPHVKGSVGLSMPDTNDAQFFVDLVDNPRFDHEYTVFAQVLNGADIVDQILEGDVIESIVITP